MVKFADTPNQKQNRLLRQKQTKGLEETPIVNPKQVNPPLLGNDPLSYEMEYLCDYPTFSFGWEGSTYPPLSFAHCENAPCWVDFSFCINGLDPFGLCDYPCSKEEILTSDCYTSNCASSSVLAVEGYYVGLPDSHYEFSPEVDRRCFTSEVPTAWKRERRSDPISLSVFLWLRMFGKI